MHNFSAQFHSMLEMAGENKLLLQWLAGIAAAAFLAVVIGGRIGRVLLVLVASAAYVLAFPAISGRKINLPGTPKVVPEGLDKLAWSIPVVGLLALLLSLRKVPWWARWIAAVVVPMLVVGLAAWPLDKAHPLAPEKWAARWTDIWHYGVAAGVVTGLIWLSTEGIAVKQKGIAPVLVTGLFAAGVVGILPNTGELQLGTFAAVPAVTVLGAFLGGLLSKRPLFDRAPVFVWIVTLGSLLGYGALDSDEKAPLFLAIIAAAPLLAWVGQIKPVSKWKPWKRELVRGIIVAAPIVTVLTLASIKSKKAAEATPKGGPDNIGGWDE